MFDAKWWCYLVVYATIYTSDWLALLCVALWISLGPEVKKFLLQIYIEMFNTGKISKEFKNSKIIAIKKTW